MTQKEIDEKIKSLVDKEFLEKLAEVAKLVGFYVNYNETRKFVSTLFYYANLEEPDLEPYLNDDEQKVDCQDDTLT